MASGLNLDEIHRWDDQSMTVLYRYFYKALVAFAAQIVSEVGTAEEIVQDTFVKIWQRRSTFLTEGALKAYLYNAVRNGSITHLRHQNVERSRMEAIEQEYALMSDTADDFIHSHHLQREEIYRQLLEAIDALPPKMRQMFLLSIEGKTCREIADELGVEPDTVKKQRQRGLERLRQMLKPESLLLLLVLME